MNETTEKPGHWIGFDLGGTKMMAVVFNGKFRPLGRKRKKSKGHEGVEAGIERIVETIREAVAESQIQLSQVAGVGIGCPGPVDQNQGVLLNAGNLGWKNVKLQKALEDKLGCRVVVANDVDAGVYGENRFGAAKAARRVLGVFPGTGIGGGFVQDGDILRGTFTSCLEIGHIQVVPNGVLCACGMTGCLETVASRLAIASQAIQAVYRGEAPHLREIAGTDLAEIRSGAIAAAIEQGDVVIERIVRQAARHLGHAIANVAHLLAPDMVVLGGGLAEALPKLLVKEVTIAAKEHMLPLFGDRLEIVAAQLGDDAVVFGAAAWAEKRLGAAA